jgi:hypothetical protein
VTSLKHSAAQWPQGRRLAEVPPRCLGSLLAVYHAIRAQKRLMAWEFLGVALLFNPLLPLFRPGDSSLVAVWISIALIVTCLTGLKTQPLLSIPSITDGNPRSVSL